MFNHIWFERCAKAREKKKTFELRHEIRCNSEYFKWRVVAYVMACNSTHHLSNSVFYVLLFFAIHFSLYYSFIFCKLLFRLFLFPRGAQLLVHIIFLRFVIFERFVSCTRYFALLRACELIFFLLFHVLTLDRLICHFLLRNNIYFMIELLNNNYENRAQQQQIPKHWTNEKCLSRKQESLIPRNITFGW